MNKYSEKSEKLVGDNMHRMKKGQLKSSSGDKVKSRKQAIAISLSEAREKGYKVPAKKAAGKKTASKKAAKKTSTRSRAKK